MDYMSMGTIKKLFTFRKIANFVAKDVYTVTIRKRERERALFVRRHRDEC